MEKAQATKKAKKVVSQKALSSTMVEESID